MLYEPREDSFLLKGILKKYSNGRKVLDMGAGSGILAREALNSKAKSVLAADINLEAVEKIKKLGIPTVQSDLFENIKGKFDLIIFNPPYLPLDIKEDKESSQATTGGKKGDEIILKFLKQAPSHLEKGGKILLLLSSLTPQDRILKLLRKQNQKYKIVAQQKLFMESLFVWEIS